MQGLRHLAHLNRQARLWRHSRSLQTALPQTATLRVSQDEIKRAEAYCTDLLKKYDAPSYTLLPFLPPQSVAAYLALRAFNVSLSHIGDTTSTPTIGMMRMQYWKDAISKSLALTPSKEPIAILLSYAMSTLASRTNGQSKLSKIWLTRVINEREKRLNNAPFADLASLEAYAENTYSTLLYLTLSSLPLASISADHVASHIGKAQGIAAVLRGIPLLAFPPQRHHSLQPAIGESVNSSSQGAITLPLDIMAQNSVREEDILRKGGDAPGLRDAVFAVATRASDHLITAREMVSNLRAGRDAGHDFEYGDDTERSGHQGHQEAAKDIEQGFGVFMQAVPTQIWLDRLQKCDFDVFHESLRQTDWRLSFKAYWAFNRRQF